MHTINTRFKNIGKTLISTFILLGLILNLSFAQDIQTFESSVEYEDQTYPSYSSIITPETDEVKEAWEDYIKDNYKVKLKGTGLFSNKDVLYAEQVQIDPLSSKNMDFYTRIIEEGDRTRMDVFGSFGYDVMLSRGNDQGNFDKLNNMLENFLSSFVPAYYEEKLAEMKEELENMEGERDDLMKDNKKMRKKIEKNKEEMAELAGKIASMEQERNNLRSEIK